MKDKQILIYMSLYQLLSNEDYTNISVAKIAKKAGIGKGTIYEYFSSKEEILCGAILYGMDLYHDIIKKEIIDSELDFESCINKFIDINLSIIQSNHSFFSLLINSPERIMTKSENKLQFRTRACEFRTKMRNTIISILDKALKNQDIGSYSNLKVNMLLPILITSIIRLSKINMWYLVDEVIDEEAERKELLSIILKLFE